MGGGGGGGGQDAGGGGGAGRGGGGGGGGVSLGGWWHCCIEVESRGGPWLCDLSICSGLSKACAGSRRNFTFQHRFVSFSSPGSTLCADSYFGICFNPGVTVVTRKRSRSFCQKCRWQITAKHAYTLRMWLNFHEVTWCMVVWCTQNLRRDGCSFMWHQPPYPLPSPTLLPAPNKPYGFCGR